MSDKVSQTFPPNGKVLLYWKGPSHLPKQFDSWVREVDHWSYLEKSELPANTAAIVASSDFKKDTTEKLRRLALHRNVRFVSVSGYKGIMKALGQFDKERLPQAEVKISVEQTTNSPAVPVLQKETKNEIKTSSPSVSTESSNSTVVSPVVHVSSGAKQNTTHKRHFRVELKPMEIIVEARKVKALRESESLKYLRKIEACKRISAEFGYAGFEWSYDLLQIIDGLHKNTVSFFEKSESRRMSINTGLVICRIESSEDQLRLCREIVSKDLNSAQAQALVVRWGLKLRKKGKKSREDEENGATPTPTELPASKVAELREENLPTRLTSTESEVSSSLPILSRSKSFTVGLSTASIQIEEVLTNPQTAAQFFRSRSPEEKKEMLQEVYRLAGLLNLLREEIRLCRED